MKKIAIFSFLVILLTPSANSQNNQVKTEGPVSGTLLIIGGNADDKLFLPQFMDLAGGKHAKIVIIPTARDDISISADSGFVKLRTRFINAGFENITILHTRNIDHANDVSFVAPFREADGIWIQGGRQWRLVDTYKNTLVHLEMIGVLHRGGVIAGTSAGATIQGSYLARGDTKTNTIMMGDHEEGLGFISNITIDQHLLARNRHFDMFEIIDNKPELLGIGLDENTGIIVEGNIFEVVGSSYVAVYDRSRWSAERDTVYALPFDKHEFYFLKNGMKYDMLKRKVLSH